MSHADGACKQLLMGKVFESGKKYKDRQMFYDNEAAATTRCAGAACAGGVGAGDVGAGDVGAGDVGVGAGAGVGLCWRCWCW